MRYAAWIVVGVFVLVVGAGEAWSDTIVSADINIINALNGNGPPVNTGNQRFFDNVLGTGSTVLVEGDYIAYDAWVNTYYDSQAGVSSSILTGDITTSALSGVDLFISILPLNAYTGSELSALSAFAAAGGDLFFLGDHSLFSAYNANINGALSALGSGLSIQNGSYDVGLNVATGSQIATHALTSGVTSLTYGYTSAVSGISGGNALFFTTTGEAFVAMESTPVVPEPASLALFGLGIAGVAVHRRRRRRPV